MMSLMVAVNASYMSNELLLCEVSLHPVADAATWHDVFSVVAFFIANTVNARVFHSGQPFCIGSRKVRGRLPTIKTIPCDYCSYLVMGKTKLPVKFLSPPAIFAVNAANPRLSGTRTRKTDRPSKLASFSKAAGFCVVPQIVRCNNFSPATFTANPPTNYGITTRVNRRFAAPDYRKMAEPLAHEIN
jgi:hypothetical protein